MTIYSTNPKMDTSGVRADKPVYGKLGTKIGSKVKSGGEFYLEAISEQSDEYGMRKTKALTSGANMRAAASLVSEGYSIDHAFDIVSKDNIWMPDKVDMIEAKTKGIKKMSKGYKGY